MAPVIIPLQDKQIPNRSELQSDLPDVQSVLIHSLTAATLPIPAIFPISTAHDSGMHSYDYSRTPYLLPTDVVPMALPAEVYSLDKFNLDIDATLTCIHDLRANPADRVPDECFLVSKRPNLSRVRPQPDLWTNSHTAASSNFRLSKIGEVYAQTYCKDCRPLWATDLALVQFLVCLSLVIMLLELLPAVWKSCCRVPPAHEDKMMVEEQSLLDDDIDDEDKMAVGQGHVLAAEKSMV